MYGVRQAGHEAAVTSWDTTLYLHILVKHRNLERGLWDGNASQSFETCFTWQGQNTYFLRAGKFSGHFWQNGLKMPDHVSSNIIAMLDTSEYGVLHPEKGGEDIQQKLSLSLHLHSLLLSFFIWAGIHVLQITMPGYSASSKNLSLLSLFFFTCIPINLHKRMNSSPESIPSSSWSVEADHQE